MRHAVEEQDQRLWIEQILLPPDMTMARAGVAALFFWMLYCFVFMMWYVALGGERCWSEHRATEAAQAEVAFLHAELDRVRGLN